MLTMHSQAYGESVDALTLIPHMLETFMARDRAFSRRRKPLGDAQISATK